MVNRAMKVAEKLEKNNISVEVINMRFLKPIDEDAILKSMIKTKNVVTIEDNILKGGLSSVVEDVIIKNKLEDIRFLPFGYPDKFIQHGKVEEVEKLYGLDEESIYNKILAKSKKIC